jgi:hypothetical protein
VSGCIRPLHYKLDSWVRNKPEHWYWITILDLDKKMPDRFES